jgi:hypothetical protein
MNAIGRVRRSLIPAPPTAGDPRAATNVIDRPRLAAGRGRPCTASPPGQSRVRSSAHPGDRGLFDNSVVGHTRIIHRRVIRRPIGSRRHAGGEWHSPHYSTVKSGIDRRDVARCRRTNPYGSRNRAEASACGRVARRRPGPDLRQPAPRASRAMDRPSGRFIGTRRPDRRGQAPKGAGGMPRRHQIRAWKAAISPGELLNERRSRDARATQGTETSQYLEEKKSTETPSVAASERGSAQTGRDTARGRGAGVVEWAGPSRSPLENGTTAGDSPVGQGPALLSGTQVGSGT